MRTKLLDPRFEVVKDWTAHGLRCVVLRHPQPVYAHRDQSERELYQCGYVCIPPSHPKHGFFCRSVELPVHGGLTFGEKMDEGYFFGFDTNHKGDTDERWPDEAVIAETEKLAGLLAEVKA